MKKKLWIMLAVLAAVVIGVLASRNTLEVRADGEHTHCICGTGTLNAGDHTSHTSVTWTAWTLTNRLPGYGDLAVGDNYYYLESNVTLSSEWSLGKDIPGSVNYADMGGRKVILCLNGKTVSYTGNTRMVSPVLTIDGNTVFTTGIDITITDCGSTGAMVLTNGTSMPQGGMFWLSSANSKLTLFNGTLDSSSAQSVFDGYGGFIDVSKSGNSFTMYGGEVKGGQHTKKYAGTIYAGTGCSVTIYGGTVSGGRSNATSTSGSTTSGVGCGGNILMSGATLTIKGGTITGGMAASRGGNVFLEKSTATMEAGTITDGHATLGAAGGVYVDGNSSFTMTGGTISNCSAYSNGGNVYCNGTMKLLGGTITGGMDRDSGGNMAIQGGNTVISGTVVIENGKRSTSKNSTTGYYTSGGNAAGDSANIFIHAANTVKFIGGTVKGRISVMKVNSLEFGGAPVIRDGAYGIIFSDDATYVTAQNIKIGSTVDGVSYPHLTEGAQILVTKFNKHMPSGSTPETLFATGANENDILYVLGKGGINFVMQDDDNDGVLDSIHKASDHTHKVYGNSPAAAASTAYSGDTDHTFTAFDSATVTTVPTNETHYYMYLTEDRTGNISLANKVHLHLCLNGFKWTHSGRILQGNSQSVGSITICDCKATGSMVGGSSDQGGTLWFGASKLTLFGGTISRTGADTHPLGGGVVCASNFDMYGGTIKNGVLNYGSRKTTTAYDRGGANVYVGTTFNMYGGTIENGVLKIMAATVDTGTTNESGNAVMASVYGFGGNVYAKNFNMYGGTIRNGKLLLADGVSVWSSGANLYTQNFKMYGGTIEGGISATNGGNIHQAGGTSTITGGTIRNGIANGGYGGNIAMDGGSLTIVNSTITGGIAKNWGGSIRVGANATLTIGQSGQTDTTVISGGQAGVQYTLDANGNVVEGSETYTNNNGGNIATEYGVVNNNQRIGTIIMYGGTVKDGVAHGGNGGNISLSNYGVLTLHNGTIQDGIANNEGLNSVGRGGNVYLAANSTFTMNDGTISGGQAVKKNNTGSEAGFGGNVFVGSGTVEQGFFLNGGTVSGGSSGSGGNVRINNGGFMKMTDGTIENSATGQNVFINISGTFTMTGGTIRNAAAEANVQINGTGSSKAFFNFSGGKLIQTGTPVNVNTYGTLTMSGNAAVIGNKINFGTNAANCSITGGYVSELYGQPRANMSGGFLATEADSTQLAEGYYQFPGTYANPDTTDTTEYKYEVAEGVIIETTSRVKLGDMPVAAVTGGGPVKKNASYTLTAPAVTGYRLLGWYEGTTELSTDETYTGTATAAKTIEALYEYGPSTGFAVTVNGTSDYTISGTTVGTKYAVGTDVTVSYTGTGTFEGWVNGGGKLMSRDAEYTFTVSGDTELTANVASSTEPLVIFYTATKQVYKARVISDTAENKLTDADFATVPAVTGKKNGRWTVGGTVVTTVAELTAKIGTALTANVNATYDADDAATYTLTVTGVEEGATGTPDTWTAYAAGDQLFENVNVNDSVVLNAENGAKTFRYYADALGNVLSTAASTNVRFREDTTIYAVYGDGAYTAAEPTVTMITARRDGTTLYFEALRSIPEGYTVKEQGILFGTAAGLTYGADGVYKYVSNGQGANDVTALTLKNINASMTIYAAGYVIFTDGTAEGIIYTEEAAK